jgi:hypothetical protein
MAKDKQEFFEAMTPVGKFLFVYLNKPQEDDNGIEWYKLTIAWPKSMYNTELKELRKAAMRAAKAYFGEDVPKLQPFLRDGDNPEHNSAEVEELFGCYYFTAKSKAEKGRPGIVDRKKNDIDPLDVYSGCTGRVSVLLGGYTNKGKKGVWVRLQNVQKAADGDRIGGKPAAKKQFDELPGGSSGDDDDDFEF